MQNSFIQITFYIQQLVLFVILLYVGAVFHLQKFDSVMLYALFYSLFFILLTSIIPLLCSFMIIILFLLVLNLYQFHNLCCFVFYFILLQSTSFYFLSFCYYTSLVFLCWPICFLSSPVSHPIIFTIKRNIILTFQNNFDEVIAASENDLGHRRGVEEGSEVAWSNTRRGSTLL